MLTGAFATHGLPKSEQYAAWSTWYGSVFEMTPGVVEKDGFEAANSNWIVGGFTVSQVFSPPSCVTRYKSFIRRNPVDHWAVTISSKTSSDVKARDRCFKVPAGIPFFLSLGEEMCVSRPEPDSRLQLLLSRDTFDGSAHLLDAVAGKSLNTIQGSLLADFLLLLKENLPSLTAEDASRLKEAVQAMIEACVAPSADRLVKADKPINVTLMERVRKAVSKHLCSPSLGTAKLCREAATSRSQLYRLLQNEGGVGRYIQRCRLSKSFAILCDPANSFAIGGIAEMLCFADASTFSRAFRREFGINPSEVRAASLCGLPIAPLPSEYDVHNFRDCLRLF